MIEAFSLAGLFVLISMYAAVFALFAFIARALILRYFWSLPRNPEEKSLKALLTQVPGEVKARRFENLRTDYRGILADFPKLGITLRLPASDYDPMEDGKVHVSAGQEVGFRLPLLKGWRDVKSALLLSMVESRVER